jgi:hypothetical protein
MRSTRQYSTLHTSNTSSITSPDHVTMTPMYCAAPQHYRLALQVEKDESSVHSRISNALFPFKADCRRSLCFGVNKGTVWTFSCVCLSRLSDEKTMRSVSVRTFIKFGTQIMPLPPCPKWYFIISFNQKYQRDGCSESWREPWWRHCACSVTSSHYYNYDREYHCYRHSHSCMFFPFSAFMTSSPMIAHWCPSILCNN